MRLDPGERLGEWEVVAQIARGGQGAVLRARHVRTGAAAAIKALVDPTDNAARRFAQEARVLERVAHPNVVRALGRGEAPGGAWLALELVEGEDLLAVVRRGVPPFELTAQALSSVALALEHCHLRGVVHRDLKPGNVLVERGTGRAVLVDFGLVKRDANAMHLSSLDGSQDGREVLSLAGELKGTPEYMAPEQIGERFGEVGPATDVWGLGATLFHLLTGEAPFGRGAAPIVMRKITRQPARDPRELNPQVPEALATLCLRCLAKEPGERPRALEVASALAAFAGRRVEAPRPASGPATATPASGSGGPGGERPRLPPRLPAPGEAFAGCKLVRPLGRGAFGAVFEAARPDGTACALKVIHAVAATDGRERFLREAEAGQSVQHEGIVRTFAHGEERGLLWLAMELVPGARTLDAYVAERALPVEDRVRLLVDVARAVDAAHHAGLVHRDLKPQNVLVSADGRAKVADLGLARHLDKERLTMSGAFMGTVHYMAPEQVTGRVKEVGPRADVWALGVMLHELIAGERPFDGDTLVEVMAAILEDPPVDPCARVAAAPPALGRVVLRALARDPAQRFESAAAFADAALAALTSRPARRRVAPALALGVLAVVVVAVVMGVALTGRARAEARRREVAALTDEAAALLASASPLGGDAARIAALRARTNELGDDLGALAPRAGALEGLAALAAGDLPGARVAAAALVDARTPEALALRGGLAALDGGDPLRAAQDLGRALDEGVARADLRAWRARALVARGPTARDAVTVVDDLAALEGARSLTAEEVGWRARALLALGRADDAAQALAAREDAPADLRWRVALARAAPLLEGAPDRARAALEGLAPPPPPAVAEDAARLAARAARDLERRGGGDDLPRVAALAGVCATLSPGACSPGALAILERRLTEFMTEVVDARYDLARAVAALAPDDARVQRAVGMVAQYTRSPERKRVLLGALRRAIELAHQRDDEALLCRQLGLLVEGDVDTDRPVVDADECLRLADPLLADERDLRSRSELLGARALARRARGDLGGALADLDEAHALLKIDAHVRSRGLVLLALGRLDEGLEALTEYMELQTEGHWAATHAAGKVWEVGRARRRLDLVERAVVAEAKLEPTDARWPLRLAWLQRARGDFAALGPTLARAADALASAGDGERAARARALAGGGVPGPALDALLAEVAPE